jgi:DNA-binding CsgD family transcriptional regulator
VTAAAPARRGRLTKEKLYEVLRLIAEGLSTEQMARKLVVSEATIGYRLRALYSDLGAVDRANAVAVGYQRGILSLANPIGPPAARVSNQMIDAAAYALYRAEAAARRERALPWDSPLLGPARSRLRASARAALIAALGGEQRA